jgi:hypothetical protein
MLVIGLSSPGQVLYQTSYYERVAEFDSDGESSACKDWVRRRDGDVLIAGVGRVNLNAGDGLRL